MHLELIRDTARSDATLGTLSIGTMIFQTLERPWVPIAGSPGGEPNESCIPAGDYTLVLHDTPKHPHTFAFVNPALAVFHEPGDVPQGWENSRTACLIHQANWASQLEGCCALGTDRSFTNGVPMILQSDEALADFQALVPWVPGHTITITEVTQ